LSGAEEARIPSGNDTHETAATQFVEAGGSRLAYRRFGRPGEFPMLLLNFSGPESQHADFFLEHARLFLNA
jgi:hypothetical protein